MPATMEAVLPYPKQEDKKENMGFNNKKAKQLVAYCAFVKKIKTELLKLNCTEEEINGLLTPNVIEKAIKSGASAEDIAWALVQ